MKSTDSLESLLSVSQVAELLNIRKSWIYNHNYTGTLPFPVVRIGGLLRFRREDIESYLWRQRESV